MLFKLFVHIYNFSCVPFFESSAAVQTPPESSLYELHTVSGWCLQTAAMQKEAVYVT